MSEKTLNSTSLGGRDSENPPSGTATEETAPHAPRPPDRDAETGLRAALRGMSWAERIFVRACLKTGDIEASARKVRHENALTLLARKPVRDTLTKYAPFTPHAAALLAPFVMEALARKALKGDAGAAKVILAARTPGKPNVTPGY